ncbi:serine/threonine-protein kinase [Umezawaea sp. Da 62-37]|uniref:serine/threonine-protein kinase n=1 Tax=Umezawaea sp. Da 62-37 TaxID=3075927 RepID=UPI0028F74288|nr:serine/threonine-protein kinase [Umezawaea sp. Da 62-37]WNV89764.1 serine/threonine-protein kinase [Umezawaea sp. Da 62-37]
MTGQQGVSAQPRVIAGRYTLLVELGRGGMGVVWRAQDNVIGRHVAIKELHLPDGVPTEERHVLEERVLREARAAGRLNDPAVVTVFDVVVENRMTYIVMELVEAATLSTLISRQGPMPPERVSSMAQQLLSALEAAHAAGIVHRDVKPGNIMVRPDGRVKLTDFGIAQAVDDPRLTTSGSLIGSPAYMAPERIHGHEASPASDLWALGATLCYAIEGVSPYERASTASTLNAIMNEVPRLTRAHGVLAAVITGLLMPDPNARLNGPQARAMLERQAANPTPPHGFAPTQSSTMHYPNAQRPKFGKARRIAVVAAAVVAAAAVFTGGIYAHKWFTTPSAGATAVKTLTYGENGDVPVFELYDGYCADGKFAPAAQLASGNVVGECDGHDLQVYTDSSTLGDGATVKYPGVEALTTYAESYCGIFFDSNRIAYSDKSLLKHGALVPTEKTWKPDKGTGKHGVFCLVWRADGKKLEKSVVVKDP